jgi:hypothetical protein
MRAWQLMAKNHYLIFGVLLIVSLSIGVYVVDLTLQAPSDDGYRDQQTNAGSTIKFDKVTIDKIKRLQRSDDQSPLAPLPGGTRANPFAE